LPNRIVPYQGAKKAASRHQAAERDKRTPDTKKNKTGKKPRRIQCIGSTKVSVQDTVKPRRTKVSVQDTVKPSQCQFLRMIHNKKPYMFILV